MIYSNIKLITKGALGTIKDFSFNPPKPKDDSEHDSSITDPSVYLGTINGRSYRYFPDDFDITLAGEQLLEIDFKKEENLSNDIKLELRAQAQAAFKKRIARKKIEMEVGDVLDLIADMGQLVEFAVVAVCALWGDKSGKIQLPAETIQDYGERGALVWNALNSGKITLRSSFEEPEKMISTIMPRYSRVQQIVRDTYINPLKDLGI